MARFVQTPETFYVEEVPEVKPAGSGSHLFVTFLRKNMSTFFVAEKLKKILKIKETEIGIAGNKDKLSTAIQTFSLPARLEPKIIRAFQTIGAEIISAELHNEKLRMGQIYGNSFKILIEISSEKDFEEVLERLKQAKEKGFPNFFGPQRVSDEKSFEEGKQLFLNKSSKRGDRKGRFLVSVFQSVVFNSYLKERIEKNLFFDFLEGDVVRIEDKLVVLQDNFFNINQNEDAVLTGPIIGSKMILPMGQSLSFEKKVVENFGIQYDDIFLSRAKGARRDLSAKPKSAKAKIISENKAELSFFLPKGSYATTLLKHIGIEIIVSKTY